MHYSLVHSAAMDGKQFMQALLDWQGLTPTAFARRAGKPSLQSTVVRFLDGNQSRASTMQPIADYFGVDVGGFFDADKADAEIARLGGAPAHTAPSPAPVPGEAIVTVPLLSNSASMGVGNEAMHEDVMIGALSLSDSWLSKIVRPSRPGALRFIHGFGDSMSPTFEDGDVLLVDTGARDPQSIDGVYVLSANSRLYIKRVRCRMDGAMEVSSDNATVKTVDVLNGENTLDVLGRVVWCWNGRKL